MANKMKGLFRKAISLLVVLAMVLPMTITTAFAADYTAHYYLEVGQGITINGSYTLTGDGTWYYLGSGTVNAPNSLNSYAYGPAPSEVTLGSKPDSLSGPIPATYNGNTYYGTPELSGIMVSDGWNNSSGGSEGSGTKTFHVNYSLNFDVTLQYMSEGQVVHTDIEKRSIPVAGMTLSYEPTPREGYVFKGWAMSEGGEVLSGPITVDGKATVYAIWEAQKGALTINKTVSGGDTEASSKAYTFDVTGPNGYTTTETITGNGSTTLNDLTPGEYTVTERDANIEGYTLEVTGGGTVTVAAGQAAQITVTNTYTENVPVLTIEKTVDRTSGAHFGDILTYTITVKNTGTAAATDVNISDAISEGLTNLKTKDGTSHADSLAVGEMMTWIVQAQVVATEGTLTNTASVTCAEIPITGPATASTTVGAPANFTLTVTKKVEGDDAPVGDKFTFKVTLNGTDERFETIGAGESFTVTGLDTNAYVIVEEVGIPENYTTQDAYNNIKMNGQDQSLIVTNTYTKPDEPEKPVEPVEHTYTLTYDANGGTFETGAERSVTAGPMTDLFHSFDVYKEAPSYPSNLLAYKKHALPVHKLGGHVFILEELCIHPGRWRA